MVTHRQECGCGRQHRECSRVDRFSGRANGRRKRTKSGSNISVVPVSYSCRTKIVQAVLERDRELRPRSDGFVTIMTDRGGLL